MATITIRLDPEQVSEMADAVIARLQSQGVIPSATPGNPIASDPGAARSDQFSSGEPISPEKPDDPVDPWGAQPARSSASAPAPADQDSDSAPTESPATPSCKHGTMLYRKAGIAQSGPRAGKPYGPFYACPAPRGTPDKCKSVSA